MFKVGDIVTIVDSEECKDYNGHYSGTKGEVFHVGDEYCEVKLYDGKIAMFPNSHIESIKVGRKGTRRCTCGAQMTDFKQFHYDWCDIHNNPSDADDFFNF